MWQYPCSSLRSLTEGCGWHLPILQIRKLRLRAIKEAARKPHEAPGPLVSLSPFHILERLPVCYAALENPQFEPIACARLSELEVFAEKICMLGGVPHRRWAALELPGRLYSRSSPCPRVTPRSWWGPRTQEVGWGRAGPWDAEPSDSRAPQPLADRVLRLFVRLCYPQSQQCLQGPHGW